MKKILLITFCSSLFFTFSVVLFLIEVDFMTFNLLEGIYWLSLGLFMFILSYSLAQKYKRVSLFTALVLVFFGITDFIEIKTGAYWIPSWLLAWNAICLAGLILSLTWYTKIKIRH